ncbi:MAG: DUF1501 domain-containing protein [Pseudomonadota bacterium]
MNVLKHTMERRRILAGLLGGGALAACPVGLSTMLASMQAAAQTSGSYKALVTIFLFGGNDSFNMLVPNDGRYADYANSRGSSLRIPQASLLGLNGTGLGMHPQMPQLQALFNSQRAAMVVNAGTMLQPVTRSEYLAGSAALPPQLFSHLDQQFQWQTGRADQLANQGWIGRIADLLGSQNVNQTLPMNVSFGGANTLQTGTNAVPYAASTDEEVAGISMFTDDPTVRQRHERMLNYSRGPLATEYRRNRLRTQGNFEQVSTALSNAPILQTQFPMSGVGQQLATVARYLAVHGTLGFQRQTFFVAHGGYDTHSAQATDHPMLLSELDTAVKAFYDATVELGMEQQVTTAILSDFGRTLSINGDGTDHGWGGHYFAVGGAVNSGIYGTFPDLVINGPDDTSGGALIPTTALEEYGATLARWFGVADAELDTIFPNLNRFDRRDLGFMTAG